MNLNLCTLLVHNNLTNNSIVDRKPLSTKVPIKSHNRVETDGEDESESDGIERYAVTKTNFFMCTSTKPL